MKIVLTLLESRRRDSGKTKMGTLFDQDRDERPGTTGAGQEPVAPAVYPSSERAEWLLIGLILGIAITATLIWLVMDLRPTGTSPVMSFNVSLPPDTQLDKRGIPLAFSPDGHQMVVAGKAGNTTRLYLRRLDQLEAVPVAGTEGACNPFFSPDGKWVAYFDSGAAKLKKTRLSDGETRALCDAPFGLGGVWTSEGSIIFAPDVYSPLYIVQDTGGQRETLTGLESSESTHRWPELSPDGQTVFFTAGSSGSSSRASAAAVSLKTRERKILLEDAACPHCLSTGHLLFLREGRIMAQPFDLRRLEAKGTAVPVLDRVRIDPSSWAAQLALSRAGALAYVPGAAQSNLRSLVWVDRQGGMRRLTVNLGVFSYPRLSPDGKDLAVAISSQNQSSHVWKVGVETGAFTRLTTEENCTMPLWTVDGDGIVYTSHKEDLWGIYLIRSGEGNSTLLVPGEHPRFATSWSPDGKGLCFTELNPETGADIWIHSVADNQSRPFLQRRGGDWGGVFSPDGKWIAYTSDESGTDQVYMRPYPGPGEPVQISTAEGAEPLWSADGRELFYRYWKGLMAVAFRPEAEQTADAPQLLVEGPAEQGDIPLFRNYDRSADGRRFVMVRSEEEAGGIVRYRLGWLEEVKKTVSAGQPGASPNQ